MGYSSRHLVLFEEPGSSRKRYINVAFESDNCLNGKNLLVRLSDDEDLYFLYSACISDDEFHLIKSQQGLLVDFAGFTQKVIDLLDLCLQEEHSLTPKYTLKFVRTCEERRTGTLQIIEATNFKYLTHLSLSLSAGDDEALKSYLVEQIKALKVESKTKISSLEQSLSALSSEFSDTKAKLDRAMIELGELKSNSRDQEKMLKKTFEEKIRSLEEKHTQDEERHRLMLMNEQERSAKVREQLCEEFHSKLERSKHENEILRESRDRFELTSKELSEQVPKLEEQVSSFKERLSVVRSQLCSSEQACQTQSFTITRLENRVASLEQDLASKEQLMTKTQDICTSEQEHRLKLQGELQSQARQLESLQQLFDKESEEVKKANEIIKHLQSEVKSHHTKAKLRGQVAAEQERLLSVKESESQERTKEMERLNGELKQANEAINSLTEQLKQTSTELTEAQKTIKTNENIIGWLNRQISENQIGQVQQRLKFNGFPTPIPSVPPNSTFSPIQHDLASSISGGMRIVPPWHPIASLSNNPSGTIISRLSSTATPAESGGNALTCTKPVSNLPSSSTASVYSISNAFDHKVKSTDVRSNFSLVPMTKSTPLHSDPVLKFGVQSQTEQVLGHLNSRLPTYLPSTLIPKSSFSNQMETAHSKAANGLHSIGPSRSGSSVGNDDSERTIHQQSLTSAYFPKCVEAHIQH